LKNFGVLGELNKALVSYGIQNVKYQLLWSDEMQNAKIFRATFSFIQNVEFVTLVGAS